MAATIANADPKTTRPPKRKFHYISFTVEGDEGLSLTEVIAEESNIRAAKGYRLHTCTIQPAAIAGRPSKALLVFERRLRKMKKKAPLPTAAERESVPERPEDPTRGES